MPQASRSDSRAGVVAASRDTDRPGVRSARQERPERDDLLHPTTLGDIEERLRVGAPPLMGLRAAKQEETVPAIGMPGKELAPWPVDVAAAVGPHPHLRPFLREHEELFGVDPGQPRGREVADQVAQGPGGRPAGVDPSPECNDHGRQVGRRLAVEFYVVHAVHLRIGLTPLGSRPIRRCRGRSTSAGRCDARSRWGPAPTPSSGRRGRWRPAPPSPGSHRGRTSVPRQSPRRRR